MADIRTDKGGIRDPLEEGEDKSQMSNPSNSRNREESMTESGKDAFGRGSAVRNPDSEENRQVQQRATKSGTTQLGGEDADSRSATTEEAGTE